MNSFMKKIVFPRFLSADSGWFSASNCYTMKTDLNESVSSHCLVEVEYIFNCHTLFFHLVVSGVSGTSMSSELLSAF